MWSEERVATLRQRWAEGFSASEIATQLGGVTRNGVIGKIHRLGITGGGQQRTTTPRAPRPPRTRPAWRAPKFAKERVMERPALVAPLNIPFLDVQQGQCRAVTDTTRYAQRCCGHPTQGTYCAAHLAIFYTPAKGRGA